MILQQGVAPDVSRVYFSFFLPFFSIPALSKGISVEKKCISRQLIYNENETPNRTIGILDIDG